MENLRMSQYESVTVYEDGTVCNSAGRELEECANGRLYYTYNGRRVSKDRARLVYNAFSDKALKNSDLIVFKDGNKKNCSFNNLIAVSCADYRIKHPITVRRRFSREEAEVIRLEYKLKGTSLRRLAKKYDCSLVTINRITRGEYYASMD